MQPAAKDTGNTTGSLEQNRFQEMYVGGTFTCDLLGQFCGAFGHGGGY